MLASEELILVLLLFMSNESSTWIQFVDSYQLNPHIVTIKDYRVRYLDLYSYRRLVLEFKQHRGK